jgi:membrane-associated phospholipid phosphatase
MLTVLYGAIVLPAFLLVVLVSWSRVVLRRHTVAQVLAGSLVSIALATAILLLRGI